MKLLLINFFLVLNTLLFAQEVSFYREDFKEEANLLNIYSFIKNHGGKIGFKIDKGSRSVELGTYFNKHIFYNQFRKLKFKINNYPYIDSAASLKLQPRYYNAECFCFPISYLGNLKTKTLKYDTIFLSNRDYEMDDLSMDYNTWNTFYLEKKYLTKADIRYENGSLLKTLQLLNAELVIKGGSFKVTYMDKGIGKEYVGNTVDYKSFIDKERVTIAVKKDYDERTKDHRAYVKLQSSHYVYSNLTISFGINSNILIHLSGVNNSLQEKYRDGVNANIFLMYVNDSIGILKTQRNDGLEVPNHPFFEDAFNLEILGRGGNSTSGRAGFGSKVTIYYDKRYSHLIAKIKSDVRGGDLLYTNYADNVKSINGTINFKQL